jgi:hypothetical protein
MPTLHGFAFWLAVTALTVYTGLVALGGFLIGRLARTSRQAERQFEAESLRLGRIAGAERMSTMRAHQPRHTAVPDLGDVLSHRAKGRRP